MFDDPQFLSTIIGATLINELASNRLKVFVAPYEGGKGLFIEVLQTPDPAFGNETSMFGKSFRLLIYLQEKYQLFRNLNTYKIERVAVTLVSSPHLINKTNTTIYNTSFLVDFYKDYWILSRTDRELAEWSIKATINENLKNFA
jgi:hypothetical protein